VGEAVANVSDLVTALGDDIAVALGSGDAVALASGDAVALGDGDALGEGECVGVSFCGAGVDFLRGLCGVGVGLAKKCLILSPSDSSSSLVPRAWLVIAIATVIAITIKEPGFIFTRCSFEVRPPILPGQLYSFACRRRDSRAGNFHSANGRGNPARRVQAREFRRRGYCENRKRSGCCRLLE
jgi:hypothetical protein